MGIGVNMKRIAIAAALTLCATGAWATDVVQPSGYYLGRGPVTADTTYSLTVTSATLGAASALTAVTTATASSLTVTSASQALGPSSLTNGGYVNGIGAGEPLRRVANGSGWDLATTGGQWSLTGIGSRVMMRNITAGTTTTDLGDVYRASALDLYGDTMMAPIFPMSSTYSAQQQKCALRVISNANPSYPIFAIKTDGSIYGGQWISDTSDNPSPPYYRLSPTGGTFVNANGSLLFLNDYSVIKARGDASGITDVWSTGSGNYGCVIGDTLLSNRDVHAVRDVYGRNGVIAGYAQQVWGSNIGAFYLWSGGTVDPAAPQNPTPDYNCAREVRYSDWAGIHHAADLGTSSCVTSWDSTLMTSKDIYSTGTIHSATGFSGILAANVPSLDASKITTGRFGAAQMPTDASYTDVLEGRSKALYSTADMGTTTVLSGGTVKEGSARVSIPSRITSPNTKLVVTADDTNGSASVRLGTLTAADIPSLPASQITSGKLGLANGGTGQDLSTTAVGVLVIDSAGNLRVRLLKNADIVSAAAIDAAKIGGGSVTNTQYSYLNGLGSPIQGQLDGKASQGDLDALSTIVGGITSFPGWAAFDPSVFSNYNASITQTLTHDGGGVSWTP